jgi:hypothetical protein
MSAAAAAGRGPYPPGPVHKGITKALESLLGVSGSGAEKEFDNAFLEVHNESHMHSVPVGSELHFKVGGFLSFSCVLLTCFFLSRHTWNSTFRANL